MKTGIAAKILSVVLSLILLGSGFMHSIIHSCGQCSCENVEISSVAGPPEKGQTAILQKSHASDSIHTVEIICPICAGLFNFVTPAEFSGIFRIFTAETFQAAPDSPVAFSDCRLPQSRAPPLS